MMTPDSLDQALARLPRELEPARDLWPGIAAALDDTGRAAAGAESAPARAPRAMRPMALAAGLATLAMVAALAYTFGARSHGGDPALLAHQATPGAALAPEGVQPAALRAGAIDDTAYRAARTALEATFEQRLGLLAPDTQARIRRDLATIRAANEDLRAALAKDPASPLLMQLLASTWRQEIDLYSGVARATAPLIQRRTRS